MRIQAAARLVASTLKRFAVYVNNGFRFDLDVVIEAETLPKARKD